MKLAADAAILDEALHHVQLCGQEIAFRRAGAGDPIIMLHNGGTSHRLWRHQIDALAATNEVFALDLLGYGASARPGDRALYSLANNTRMLEEFIDQQGLAPVTLVGSCMGSAMSLTLAMRAPEKVRAMVLVNPLTTRTMQQGQVRIPVKSLGARFPKVVDGFARVGTNVRVPAWAAVSITRLFLLGPRGRSLRLHRDADLVAALGTRGIACALSGIVCDRDDWTHLDQPADPAALPPIQTVWGKANRGLSAAEGAELDRRLGVTAAAVFEDCGHLLPLERPDELTQVIRDFVARADSGRS